MSRTFKTSVLAAVFFLFLALPALAQTGRIVGTVTDETGAVVPGTTVTATSQATNLTRKFDTDDTGNYDFPGLAVATYIVRAELSGFQTAEVEVLVEIDRVARQNIRLAVGQPSDVLHVLADAPLLQTDSVEVGQVVTNRQIVELPLNGRRYTDLALLVPGVTTRGPGRDGGVGVVSVNGSRGGRENYMIDSVTTNSSYERAPQFLPSIESIQEFKLQTSTFSAEFGRGSAAFNLTTKSGSNQYHGVVYHFWRNDSLAANDFFVNQLPDPDSTGAFLNRNQFGATFGGPIVGDKTFFFVNYEGERLREGLTQNARVPTDLERSGDFSQSPGVLFIRDPETEQNFPGKVVPQSRFHNVYNYFQGWWPRPNTSDGFLISSAKTAADNDEFGVRIDHSFTEKDNIFFRFYYFRRDAKNPGIGTEPFLLRGNLRDIDSQQYVAHWTHSFSPRLLLDFQYSRIESDWLARSGASCFEEEGCTNHVLASGMQNMEFTTQFYPGAPRLNFGGGWAQLSGSNDPRKSTHPTNSWKTDFTWIQGSHTIKGGIDFYRQDIHLRFGNAARGVYSMNGAQTSKGKTPWSDFMLGAAGSSSRAFPTTRIGNDYRNFHYYIQDDWKLSSRLTVNIGLRYEYNLFPTPTNGGGSIDPATGNIIFADHDGDGLPHGEARNAPGFEQIFPLVKDALVSSTELGLAPSMTHTDKNNLAPRLGIAWRPLGDRTVVRAGYGVFYTAMPTESNLGNTIMPPYSVNQIGTAGDINTLFPPGIDTIGPRTWQAFALDTTQQWPYEQNFSLNVQHSLTNNLIAEVGYVGRTGTHLVGRSNVILPADRPSFVPASTRILEANSTSNYHSLQTRLEKRYSSGLAFSGAYTWSKAMDRSSDDRDSGGIDGNGFNFVGVADFDIPHRLVVNMVYDLPIGYGRQFLSGRGGLVDALLGGWQLSTIAQFQSGHPFHVRWQGGSNGGRIAVIPDRIADGTLDNPTPERWFDSSAFVPHVRETDANGNRILTEGNTGRNIFRSDGMANFDIGIMKNWIWGEQYRIQFRAEMFNAFNHVQFSRPGNCGNGCYGKSRAGNNPSINHGRDDGRVLRTNSIPRQIQFALKLFF